MKKNLPAKRYDPFITFFEKIVAKAQEDIEKARSLESLYVVAKDILEKHDFPNSITLKRENNFLEINILLQEENHWKDFTPFVEDIAKELHRKNLRSSSEAVNMNTSSAFNTFWRFSVKNNYLDINLLIVSGMKYYNLELKIKDVKQHYYEGTWRDKDV